MCGTSDVKCEIKVTELENGYRVQITGGEVKEALKPEGMEKCIRACCSGGKC